MKKQQRFFLAFSNVLTIILASGLSARATFFDGGGCLGQTGVGFDLGSACDRITFSLDAPNTGNVEYTADFIVGSAQSISSTIPGPFPFFNPSTGFPDAPSAAIAIRDVLNSSAVNGLNYTSLADGTSTTESNFLLPSGQFTSFVFNPPLDIYGATGFEQDSATTWNTQDTAQRLLSPGAIDTSIQNYVVIVSQEPVTIPEGSNFFGTLLASFMLLYGLILYRKNKKLP